MMSSKGSIRKSKNSKGSNAEASATMAILAGDLHADDIARHVQDMHTPEREQLEANDSWVDKKNDSEKSSLNEESDDDSSYNDVLANAIESLYDLVQWGRVSPEELCILMEYIDAKLKYGMKRNDLARRITTTNGRAIIYLLAKHVRDSPGKLSEVVSSITQSPQARVESLGQICSPTTSLATNSTNGTFTTENSNGRGEKEWSKFSDEHDKNEILTSVKRQIWIAQMKVKIERAKELSRELTAKMAHKSFTKFKTTDCFDRWARDLQNELMPIPLCGKRLELGELSNPRLKPEPDFPLYRDSNDIFDGDSYQHALQLYEMLDDLGNKTSGFIYTALNFCMTDNEDAQQVIRSDVGKHFFNLFKMLRARFEKNSQLEKERLMEEFKELGKKSTETLREFFARLMALVSELRTTFQRLIHDEDIRSVFKNQLSETSKNNFLQLEKTPEYKNQLNDLCQEVIRRDEELQQSLGSKLSVNNMSGGERFQGECFYCGKYGHRAVDCRTAKRKVKPYRGEKPRQLKPNFEDKNKQLQVTIDGNKNKKPDAREQVNLAEKADENNGMECIECYICHARGEHDSIGCPNGELTVKLNNRSYMANKKQNAREDAENPNKKYRLA